MGCKKISWRRARGWKRAFSSTTNSIPTCGRPFRCNTSISMPIFCTLCPLRSHLEMHAAQTSHEKGVDVVCESEDIQDQKKTHTLIVTARLVLVGTREITSWERVLIPLKRRGRRISSFDHMIWVQSFGHVHCLIFYIVRQVPRINLINTCTSRLRTGPE